MNKKTSSKLQSEILVSLLQSIQMYLPLIAEEGETREKISVEVLLEKLSEGRMVAPDAVRTTVKLVESFFFRMGWLDPFELEGGRWQFMSFPASLAARSWLSVMGSTDGCWYPPGWWSDEANQETQRKMLRSMEERRLEKSESEQPQPIRMIYVAWALIKLEGRYLLCEREDKKRDGVPHFVMAGGRLNAMDVKQHFPDADQETCLKILQNHDSEKAHQALGSTLVRELEEELGLKQDHFEFDLNKVLRLKPFLKLEGARANHAYTRYEIDLFPIELNFNGLKQLLKMEALMESEEYPLPGRLSWFSADELYQSQKQNQRAFIEAWHQHYSSLEEFHKSIIHHPESFQDESRVDEKIDFPNDPSVAFLIGETGREREVLPSLLDKEIDCLVALAWHRKFGSDYPLQTTKGIQLLRLGWVEIMDPERLQMLLRIQRIMQANDLDLIQSHDRRWFRVSVSSNAIFFNQDLFSYELLRPEPDRWELKLYFEQLDSDLGNIPKTVFVCQLGTEKRFQYLKSVEEGQPSLDIFSEPRREMRKIIDPMTQPCGLRKLVREIQGDLQIVCLPYNPM